VRRERLRAARADRSGRGLLHVVFDELGKIEAAEEMRKDGLEQGGGEEGQGGLADG